MNNNEQSSTINSIPSLLRFDHEKNLKEGTINFCQRCFFYSNDKINKLIASLQSSNEIQQNKAIEEGLALIIDRNKLLENDKLHLLELLRDKQNQLQNLQETYENDIKDYKERLQNLALVKIKYEKDLEEDGVYVKDLTRKINEMKEELNRNKKFIEELEKMNDLLNKEKAHIVERSDNYVQNIKNDFDHFRSKLNSEISIKESEKNDLEKSYMEVIQNYESREKQLLRQVDDYELLINKLRIELLRKNEHFPQLDFNYNYTKSKDKSPSLRSSTTRNLNEVEYTECSRNTERVVTNNNKMRNVLTV